MEVMRLSKASELWRPTWDKSRCRSPAEWQSQKHDRHPHAVGTLLRKERPQSQSRRLFPTARSSEDCFPPHERSMTERLTSSL